MISMINKFITISILLLLLGFVSCAQVVIDSSSPQLDYFSTIPDEIDGETCCFFLKEEDYINNRYLFVNDFALYGYIVIDGEHQILELVKYDSELEKYYYQNKEKHIEIQIIKDKNDGQFIRARLTVSTPRGQVSTIVLGKCDC